MTQQPNGDRRLLRRLARLYDVQTSYIDLVGKRVDASNEALVAAVRALGAHTEDGLQQALDQRERELWQWCLPVVVVAWEGQLPRIEMRLPAGETPPGVDCRLTLEDGTQRHWAAATDDLPIKRHELNGERYVALTLPVTGRVALGYHTLVVEAGSQRLESMLVAAPRRAFGSDEKQWGVFLPLYALRSLQSWGVGDMSDLGGLLDWATAQGASFAGMLPLLSTFLNQPYEPSPYSPVTRLFWSELYLDVEKAGPVVHDVLDEARRLNQEPLVPYREAMALKRRVVQERALSMQHPERDAFHAFLGERPDVADYAAFRAASERLGHNWRAWPERQRRGELDRSDYDMTVAGYYALAQWRLQEQVEAVKARSKQSGVGLYVDLPVGVHSDGYDAWRYQALFVESMAVGAPPDIVTTSGQNWGFQPLSPQALRASRYDYFIRFIRHHLSLASILRIDHVMGLHRLYWIPAGAPSSDGVYVKYPAEEQYAVLCLESQRQQAAIVGENLGIVPASFNRALARHNIGGMYVMSIELHPEDVPPFRTPPADSVASMGTHDLPSFAAFWTDADLADRVRLGVLNEERAAEEQSERSTAKETLVLYLQREGLVGEIVGTEDVYNACMGILSASESRLLMLNLEDAWAELEPQNIPGTTTNQYPSWQHRARYGLEEFDGVESLRRVLDIIRERRPALARTGGRA